MRTSLEDARDRGRTPVLAGHRREELDLRRPLASTGGPVADLRRLPAPPRHEWLEVVKYWTSGGRSPVWFAADPLRSDLALIDRGPAVSFDWAVSTPVLLGGVRPNVVEWHTFDRPGWFLGEGWALTPETAGVAQQDHRGPAFGPVEGWIRRRAGRSTLMIGGRNMNPSSGVRLRAAIADRVVDDEVVAPGFFLRFIDLPAGHLDGQPEYVRLTAAADDPRLALEQFDVQSEGRLMFGYGDGWYEHEYKPSTGVQWRWTSGRAEIVAVHGGRPARLSLAGETETFTRRSRVRVLIGDRVVAEDAVGKTFSFDVGIPASLLGAERTVIAIETDQTYVPAERSRPERRPPEAWASGSPAVQLTPVS